MKMPCFPNFTLKATLTIDKLEDLISVLLYLVINNSYHIAVYLVFGCKEAGSAVTLTVSFKAVVLSDHAQKE